MLNLDTLRSVPPEIIRAIVIAAGVENIISIKTWKNALSVLWVCREWRVIAEPILFSMLIYGAERRSNIGCLSNHELILQRHCFDRVKQIVVRDNQDELDYSCGERISPDNYVGNKYPNNIGMMVHIGGLFDDKAGKKDVDTLDMLGRAFICYAESDDGFEYYFEHDGNPIVYNEDEFDDICSDASTSIVFKLVALCPNVTHISLRFCQWSVTNKVLADVLVNSYIKQLLKYECDIDAANLKLTDGHHIRSLVFGNFNPERVQSALLPPNHVKNLGLLFKGEFSWNLFQLGDLVPVSYDNLIRLELNEIDRHIIRTAGIMAPDSQSAKDMPLVVFPKLQTLAIRRKIIPYKSLKYLLRFPVKIIRVDGDSQHVYQLYRHNLDNIDRLILKINCHPFHFANVQTDFIERTNKLFAKTNNISEVHLELDLCFMEFDLADINWIHLTHIYIYVRALAGQIFTAISKMPNLVYLETTIEYFKRNEALQNIIETIAELRQISTEPLLSKISSINIMCIDFSPTTELIEALEFLKWYLPKLEKLSVLRDRDY